MKKKITISIDEELIKRLDECAKRHYIDRTSTICMLLSRALDNDEYIYRKATSENEIEEIIEQSNFL